MLEMYCDKDTQVMVNQSVHKFYTRFIFKMDVLSQDIVFPLDIVVTFFNNLSSDMREFLVSEGIQFHPRLPTETNHQDN